MLLRHDPAVQELQRQEGNGPRTTGPMLEVPACQREGRLPGGTCGSLGEVSREVALSWVFLTEGFTWRSGDGEGPFQAEDPAGAKNTRCVWK